MHEALDFLLYDVCVELGFAHIHPEVGCLYGPDPLAALAATLDFLSILIRGSEDDGLTVWWQTEGDHAGLTFPLSEGKKWKETPLSMR